MSDWISVKERLPVGVARKVLVLTDINKPPIEWNEGWWTGEWVQTRRCDRNRITHWAEAPPLPEFPLTAKEALREAISQLEVTAGNLRSSRYADWFQLEVDGITNITLPRLRAALEGEE